MLADTLNCKIDWRHPSLRFTNLHSVTFHLFSPRTLNLFRLATWNLPTWCIPHKPAVDKKKKVDSVMSRQERTVLKPWSAFWKEKRKKRRPNKTSTSRVSLDRLHSNRTAVELSLLVLIWSESSLKADINICASWAPRKWVVKTGWQQKWLLHLFPDCYMKHFIAAKGFMMSLTFAASCISRR